MPISTEEDNKQRNERKGKIRGTISKAVSDSKNQKIGIKESLLKPLELVDVSSKRKVDLENKNKNKHWGYHLLLDISGCNKNIDDEKVIEKFLKTLVKEIKMKPLGDPIIVRVDSKKEGRGVSAVQIIESSTITCHFDDEGNAGYIDIFSCAPYEPKVAIDCIKKFFEPKHIGDLFIYRDAAAFPK
jgi:S-adenosylmethionine/arginine decarboxylase-like enzyme